MKEREIFDKIRDFVESFDRKVKKVVLPATLGVGLALGGCGPVDEAEDGRAKTTQARGKADGPDGGMVALYAAPFPGPQGQCTAELCGTATGVPNGDGQCYCDDLCSDPLYNDCCDNKAETCDGGGGMVALYAAPFPEPDPAPGPQPEYAAPFPDQGSCVGKCGTSTPVPNGEGKNCYCDDQCSQPEYLDCCEDKAEVCDQGPVALYAAPFPGEGDGNG